MFKILSIAVPLLIIGCGSMPEGIKPVDGFELERYLGKWYEAARLDHSFEKGLDNVSAEYSLRKDGKIKVLNKGFSASKNRWKTAEGKAKFAGKQDQGFLKVSFFGPFYGSYVIFELDMDDYNYAFVSGPDTSYLWLLSRVPDPDGEIIDKFIKKAGDLGFNTDNLIFVKQNLNGGKQ